MDQNLTPGVRLAGIAAALCAAAVPGTATAGSSSTSLTVNATVTANCTISTSPVNFGSVNTLSGSNVDASGGVTVTCTNGTAWTAAADAGSGVGATLAVRRMSNGSNVLNYGLFTDSGRTSLWGDGTSSTATVGGTGSGSTQSFTIYGRVPAGQNTVPAGSYSDTVSVTVTY